MRERKPTKKGFTIVELVIVVGVIGILSGILIPTFIGLTSKAQDASDQSFCKNANTALAMTGKHTSMRQAIKDVREAAGLDIIGYKASNGHHLIYDPAADRFAIVDDNGQKVYAEGDLKVTRPGEMLEVADSFNASNQKFGIYASPEWDLEQTVVGTESAPLTVSFDAGDVDNITSIYFKRANTDPAYSHGLIATGDNLECEVTIDAPADAIHHDGGADNIHIKAVADESYHEHGYAFKPIIIDAGHFVIEAGADVVVEPSSASVTVAFVGSSSATVNFPAASLDQSKVTELRVPGFVSKFKQRVSRLDSVETITTNKNPNRNTFYKNAEGTYDVYKIGDDNPLEFPLTAVTIDNQLRERLYKNPENITWTATDGTNNYSASGSHDVINYTNGQIVLANDGTALGKTFTFTATSQNGKSVSFQFQAVDGYNVVDAGGLSLFDNNHLRDPDHDFWAEYKASTKATPLDSKLNVVTQPNALILHNDISLKNTDFPTEYFYTAQEVKQYFQSHSGEMHDFLNMKNSLRRQYKLPTLNENEVMRMLTGSMKDDYALYYRGTSEHFVDAPEAYSDSDALPDFTFEGNYFTIDASHLKKVFFFGSRYTGTSYQTGKLSEQVFDGSHTTLFGINCSYDSEMRNKLSGELLLPERGVGGANTFKNLTIIGNGARSNNDDCQGAVFGFKVDATKATFTNVNISKTFTAFMTQCGDYKFQTDPEHYPVRPTDTANIMTPTPVMHIDRCKAFDSYNSMLYIYGTNHNYITNSHMKGAGGGIMLLDERLRSKADQMEHHNGGYFTGHETRVDCANVYFENYVSPTDVWFVTHNASELMTMVALNGNSTGWMKANADHAQGKLFTKVENDATLVNVIALDMDARYATGNTSNPLTGHIKVWDKADLLASAVPATVPSTIAATIAQVDVEGLTLLSGLDMAMFNTDASMPTFPQIYRMGTEAYPKVLIFSDVTATNIAMIGAEDGTVGIKLDYYKAIGQEEGDPQIFIPLQDYVDGLAQTDYLGCYIKPAAGTKFLGMLLGQN